MKCKCGKKFKAMYIWGKTKDGKPTWIGTSYVYCSFCDKIARVQIEDIMWKEHFK